MLIRNDCVFFKGDIPCKPHKKWNVHCENCKYYKSFKERILIIKLGAAGDVIRTTPILRKIREIYPDAEITWLTHYPLFVPNSYVNNILKWNIENILWLQNTKFDFLINLDKDKEVIALAMSIKAKDKKGYLMDNFGHCKPANSYAENKWFTGLFDDVSRKNSKSYPEEIFEILNFPYHKEEYILEIPEREEKFNIPEKKIIIGLNTGCGTRWLTRLWGKDNWIKLSKMLNNKGYFPLLLGGKMEDKMNKEIAAKSPAFYPGFFPLEDFLLLVNHCNLVVTSVTMTLHIAIALKKKIVLFNNIFNRNEFELYGLGEILEPADKNCLGCYKNSCPKECMSTILPETVEKRIEKLI
ncbi:MAG: glycosyltransferase family 9 protein [Bacteroidetes bacterium]|nr:MAG: glycosyltransferase family 9 protein [Bacteroidota bacterium]